MAHRDQGFAVIGVNLDSLGQDLSGKPADRKEVRSHRALVPAPSPRSLAEH